MEQGQGFTTDLWRSIEDIYTEILAHPFLTGLTDGTLPEECFRHYVLHVRLYSDSSHLVNGMRQRWYASWENNGWRNARNRAVKNADTWRELVALSRRHDVEFVKVSGHSFPHTSQRALPFLGSTGDLS